MEWFFHLPRAEILDMPITELITRIESAVKFNAFRINGTFEDPEDAAHTAKEERLRAEYEALKAQGFFSKSKGE